MKSLKGAKKSGSIPRFRSQREIRVQFSRQGGHDLIAIRYVYSMPRGYQSRHRDTHEIMFSVAVSGFRVSRLATPDIILKHCGGGIVPKRLISPGYRGWPVVMGSGEVRPVVGSGPVPYTSLARLNIGL